MCLLLNVFTVELLLSNSYFLILIVCLVLSILNSTTKQILLSFCRLPKKKIKARASACRCVCVGARMCAHVDCDND